MKSLLSLIMLVLSSFAHANDYPNAISVQDAKVAIEKGTAVLIDVREKDEVATGMAAPAQWFAKSSIDADKTGFLKFLTQQGDKTIIIYCRSGHRASLVIQKLEASGIKAWNMGAYEDWLNAGYPIRNN